MDVELLEPEACLEKMPAASPESLYGGVWVPGDGWLDPHRTIPRELRAIWFGAGLHFCIGAPIARAEIRALLELLAAVPGLHIVGRRPARGLFPAYRELWVRR